MGGPHQFGEAFCERGAHEDLRQLAQHGRDGQQALRGGVGRDVGDDGHRDRRALLAGHHHHGNGLLQLQPQQPGWWGPGARLS